MVRRNINLLFIKSGEIFKSEKESKSIIKSGETFKSEKENKSPIIQSEKENTFQKKQDRALPRVPV